MSIDFLFADEILTACGSGALFWRAESTLCVSDLHLGRSERIAREGGHIIPPYENTDTLHRLDAAITAFAPQRVICLGDSFDDLAATEALTASERDWILRLQAGREWIWVEGNHDPAPLNLAGTHRQAVKLGTLTFRHIASNRDTPEVSGHFHPKARVPARGRGLSRPCFLFDDTRLILPAFGTYTGGMPIQRAPLATLVRPNAHVILTGPTPRLFPRSALI